MLDFKVSNPYFPNRPLTVKQLAAHTSGILDRENVYEKTYIFNESAANISLENFLQSYLTEKGRFYSRRNFARRKPGTAFNYSNIGATLAAYLIEVKAGMSFADFTAKYVLQPLQMKDSGWFDRTEQSSQTATLYDPQLKPYPIY